MWLRLFSCRAFKETFKNARWRKVKQMQPMWLCLFSGKRFDKTFENAQWRNAKQMHSMWLCLFSGKQFEDTFENAQKWKVKNAANVNLLLLGLVFCGDIWRTNTSSQYKLWKEKNIWFYISSLSILIFVFQLTPAYVPNSPLRSRGTCLRIRNAD